MKEEHVIELYDFWDKIKTRLGIIDPQPRSFTLRKEVIPTTSLDGSVLKILDFTTTDTVTHAPTSTTQLLQPDKGKLWIVRGIYYNAPDPVGSAAGHHDLSFYPMNIIEALNKAAIVKGNFGTQLIIGLNSTLTGDTEQPTGTEPQMNIIYRGLIWASYDCPAAFVYTNTTDVDQTGNRKFYVLVEERIEGAK